MANRSNRARRTKHGARSPLSGDTTDNETEQKVVAFAEQLGRVAGTIQAKAAGWMSTDTLHRQIASVRDGAANLLEHLVGGSVKAAKKNPPRAARTRNKGRGGVVDAPGKKHRPPVPTDPEAAVGQTQAAKGRAAKPRVRITRRRGRS